MFGHVRYYQEFFDCFPRPKSASNNQQQPNEQENEVKPLSPQLLVILPTFYHKLLTNAYNIIVHTYNMQLMIL